MDESFEEPIINTSTVSFGSGEQLVLELDSLETSPSTDFLTAALGVDDRMPFLQMLQNPDPNNLQSFSMKKNPCKVEHQILEVDSCITLDMPELQSPVTSEAKNHTMMNADCIQEEVEKFNSVEEERGLDSSLEATNQTTPHPHCGQIRKRKRTRTVVKNKEDEEQQRMIHIATERNRRRQMGEYLSLVQSLLPPVYAEKGDQASIVAGAIDYVKELEQLLQSLEMQKLQRKMNQTRRSLDSMLMSSEASVGVSTSTPSSSPSSEEDCIRNAEMCRKKPHINIRVIQTHVNLQLECDAMRHSQLIQFVVALEELRLSILHLNITSTQMSSFYSLSLQMEEVCKLRSVDDISGAVEQILSFINNV